MSVSFAGNGRQDVGDGSMPDQRSPGMTSGGPVQFAKGMEESMTASGEVINEEGSVPDGSGVQFTKGNDW